MKEFKVIQRTTSEGQVVALPTATILGANPGPTLATVAAVHGCEFCGVEASIRLFRDLKPEEMAGTLRIVMVANIPAFRSRTMYTCPIDGQNLGRCFPGSSSGTYSHLLAHTIWKEVISDAEFVLDLHGGDLIEVLAPYIGYFTTGNQDLDKKMQAFAEAFGARNNEVRPLPEAKENLSLVQAALSAGKVGLLVEAGSQGRREEKDILFHYQGVLNVMRHIGMLHGRQEKTQEIRRYLGEFIGIRANTEGIFYPSVAADDVVKAGQDLGQIRSFAGEILEEVKSPVQGVILGVITPAGTYEGSMLFGIGRLKES